MKVVVNGSSQDYADAASVADVVATLAQKPRGIAVAVNGSVVPRSEWAAHQLNDGDSVEVLTAVGGG